MSKNIGELKGRIEMEATGFKDKMAEARSELDKTANSSQNLARDFGAIQKGAMVVGGAVIAAIGGSVKVAADFEQGMAKVKAISGATSEEFKLLEEAARKAGSETVFSATDGADALSYLAMAGFTVKEQIASLPAVLNAAIAGNVDLASSADMVSNIMTGFGFTAEDTGHAVDVLVTAMTTANTDLPMLAEGMKYVAPVAKALGWSFEDTATALGKLSDAGIQGGQAGTVLRASLLSLANPVGATSKVMKDLGIEVTDANGKMKALPDLMGHIAQKMEGMTDSQKTQTAAQLVGTQAASGFLALLEVGETELRDYSKALENSAGKAQEMADIQSDTLVGSFKEFQSIMEEVGIKIGKDFLPFLRDIVLAGTDIVAKFGEIDGKSISLSLAFVGITSAVAFTLATLGKLSLALSAFAMTPVGAAILGLSLLAGVIGTVIISTNEAKEVNLEYANTLIEEQKVLEGNIAAYDELNRSMKLSTDELARFVDINSLLLQTADPAILAALKEEQEQLQKKSGLTNEQFTEFLRLNDLLIETVPESNVLITEQGNALLGTTDAAKELNKEKLRFIQLELEAQMATAEANQEKLLRDQEAAQKDINKANEEAIRLKKLEKEVNIELGLLKRDLEIAIKNNDELEIDRLREKISLGEDRIESIKGGVAEQRNLILEKEKELEKINKGIGLLDESRYKLVEVMLAQQGLNAEKGKELSTIDSAISKLQAEKRQIEANTPQAAKHTQEYRDGVAAIDKQISGLQSVRGQIIDLTGQAGSLNSVLGRGINKKIHYELTGYRGGKGPQELHHSGGIVGRNTLPKMHTGGPVSQVVNRLKNTPMHSEIDIRALPNEMILTESQQANLFKIIDAGLTSGGKGSFEGDGRVIELLEVIADGIQNGRDVQIIMESREVGRMVEKHVTEQQMLNEKEKRLLGGGI